MIKLVEDTIDRDDIIKLKEWLNEDNIPKLTKGELTKEFERNMAEYIGTKYSVFVSSGSAAILLMLSALKEDGRLKNNKIVVPNISWLTDVSTPINLGLEPILCDCNMRDLSVNLEHLEEIFKNERPSALILVSVLGLVPDMNKVESLCKKYNVILLEDFCESLGSKNKYLNLGSYGLMSCTSTYFGHIMSTIEGGFVFTDDEDLYDLMLMLRSHGWDRDLSDDKKKKIREKWNIDSFNALYTFYYSGYNLRANDLQAFIGINQLKKLEDFVNKRNNNYKLYKSLIKNNMLELNIPDYNRIANFAFPVLNKNKEKIVKALIENKVEVRPLISGSMGTQPFWVKRYGPQVLKNSTLVDKYGFYVPNHQDLTKESIEFISSIINKNS